MKYLVFKDAEYSKMHSAISLQPQHTCSFYVISHHSIWKVSYTVNEDSLQRRISVVSIQAFKILLFDGKMFLEWEQTLALDEEIQGGSWSHRAI